VLDDHPPHVALVNQRPEPLDEGFMFGSERLPPLRVCHVDDSSPEQAWSKEAATSISTRRQPAHALNRARRQKMPTRREFARAPDGSRTPFLVMPGRFCRSMSPVLRLHIPAYMTSSQSRQRPGFADRRHGGAVLAQQLQQFAGRTDVVVLALPRGGVPVAVEVARTLGAPLDVFVVRKLGVPGYAELAMGAIASGGVRVLNDDVLAWYQPSPMTIEAVTRAERQELERRERAYRDGRPLVPVEGRVVILVDDGLATGSTMRAAVLAVRRLRPARVVVAVPVGAWQTCEALRDTADEVVCALTPEPFSAVGLWYRDFSQTTDEEVRQLLAGHRPEAGIKRSA
jgi:predicted phosphoribosyltransferase